MLKTLRLIGLAAAAALVLPALAGSWPPIASPKAKARAALATVPAKVATTGAAAGTFAPAAGEAGWQLVQPEYAYDNGRFVQRNVAPTSTVALEAVGMVAGFEPAAGDAGWQLAQHKYDFVSGKFAMSEECDHAIRVVKAPTPAQLEQVRRLQSGG